MSVAITFAAELINTVFDANVVNDLLSLRQHGCALGTTRSAESKIQKRPFSQLTRWILSRWHGVQDSRSPEASLLFVPFFQYLVQVFRDKAFAVNLDPVMRRRQ